MIVNKKQLADIMGVSERTLTEWQEKGMPIRLVGGPGLENQYDTAECIQWRIQHALAGEERMSPRDRRDTADAMLKEMDLAERAGKLLSVEEVRPAIGEMIMAARADLQELGPRLKAMLDARYGIDLDQQLIDDEIHHALTKLSDELEQETDETLDDA